MAENPDPVPLYQLPTGLLDRVVGCLELWDLAAARAACQTLRAAAGRRATRLVFSPASLQDERSGNRHKQVGHCQRAAVAHGAVSRRPCAAATARKPRPSRALARPTPQKRCPTAFQLFPNAREVVLVAPKDDNVCGATRPIDVPRVFRLPSAPADAAAARAALAGVTRLELRGERFDQAQLAAALLQLPGLRAVVCGCEMGAWRPEVAAALAGCPGLESLEWRVTGQESQGAQGLDVGADEGADRVAGAHESRRPLHRHVSRELGALADVHACVHAAVQPQSVHAAFRAPELRLGHCLARLACNPRPRRPLPNPQSTNSISTSHALRASTPRCRR
jgi:hypothetical protein